MSVRIINADVFKGLAQLEDESVQCVVTSPPYWGLRDYGVDGQIGLEASLGEHIDIIVRVFAEVHRVLKNDGTVWLNYGDSYAGTPNGKTHEKDNGRVINPEDDRVFTSKPITTTGPINRSKRMARGSGRWGLGNNSSPELKPKDLCMVPNRIAIALQEWGWWVRSEIIWYKPNPMPESIMDRPTSSHEKIWLLSKSQRYFYDNKAVRETALTNDIRRPYAPGQIDARGNGHDRGGGQLRKIGQPKEQAFTEDVANEPLSRNLRNVWEIATRAFPDAHFATFPPELAERCIKAGCPVNETVLDPFGGSGTTGLVADRLERDAILIEINPEYAAMAKRRIEDDCPMFIEICA